MEWFEKLGFQRVGSKPKLNEDKVESIFIARVYEGRAAQISDLADWMHLAGEELKSSPRRTKFILYERQLKDMASDLLNETTTIRKSNV